MAIVKLDSIGTMLFQFVDKDQDGQIARLTITCPGTVEGSVYYPAESVTVFGGEKIVKLYEFLGECVAEAKLVKQTEFLFTRSLGTQKELPYGKANDRVVDPDEEDI